MHIDVFRFSDNGESTLGLVMIDDQFACYSIEDTHRKVKVWGKTRIPSGIYNVALRSVGNFSAKYLRKYGARWHKGMLHVENVPNYSAILIHKGNHAGHSAGCLLLGDKPNNNQVDRATGFVAESGNAYKRFYPVVRDAILRGEAVMIQYTDWQRALQAPNFVESARSGAGVL